MSPNPIALMGPAPLIGGPLPPDSAGLIKITDPHIIAALEGKVSVRATACIQFSSSNESSRKEGIVIGQSFIPVDLPPEVVSGDPVDVKVISKSDGLYIRLTYSPSFSSSLSSSPPRSNIDAILESVVATVSNMRFTLEDLKRALTLPPLQLPEETAKRLTEMNEIGLTERELTDPVRLKERLVSINTSKALEQIEQVKRELSTPLIEKVAPLELLSTLTKALDEFLREPASPPQAREGVKNLVDLLIKIANASHPSEPVPPRGSKEFTPEEVETFVATHLEQVRRSTANLSEILRTVEHKEPLPLLVELLSRLESLTRSRDTATSEELNLFAREVKALVVPYTEGKPVDEQLRTILEQTQDTLDKRFRAQSSVEKSMFIPSEEIPRKYHATLKAIDAQIRTLLTFLEQEVPPSPERTQTELLHLINALNGLDLRDTEISTLKVKDLLTFKNELTETLKQRFSEFSRKEHQREEMDSLKDELRKAVQRLNDEFRGSRSSVIEKMKHVIQGLLKEDVLLNTNEPYPLSKDAHSLVQTLERTLKDLPVPKLQASLTALMTSLRTKEGTAPRRELNEAIDSLDKFIPSAPLHMRQKLEELRRIVKEAARGTPLEHEIHIQSQTSLLSFPKVLQDFPLKHILSVVKHVMTQLPNPHSPLEKELVQHSKEFLEILHDGEPARLGKTREEMSRAARKFKERTSLYLNEGKDELYRSPPAATHLENLEGFVRSHEVLHQLAPLMSTLGEPIILLFPTLIEGFLSRTEMTFSLPNPDEEISEHAGEEQDSTKDEAFQRIKLDFTLPNLGPIHVDIAHRRQELLVALKVENKEVEAFIRESLPMLQRSLLKLGFSDMKCGVEVRRTSHIIRTPFARADQIIA